MRHNRPDNIEEPVLTPEEEAEHERVQKLIEENKTSNGDWYDDGFH